MTKFSDRLRYVGRAAVGLAVVASLAGGLLAPAVGAQDADLNDLEGEIASDGSSTVGPITQAVAEEFQAAGAANVDITVDVSGTGGGFKRFCGGETDVQNASRAIAPDEAATCADNGVGWYEFEVAYDGLTVVVNEANDFLTCLTTEQLTQLWQKDSLITTWADVNPEFPAEEIALYGPGTDSGTFDFFVETILGEDGDIRENFTPSEDDNVLVEGVAGDENALGYFGYAYYAENEDTLNAVAIDPGDGNCVAPTPETIADGSYVPLSRPLYVYVNSESLERPEVQGFMRFYVENAGEIAADVGFVPSPDESYAADADKLEAAIAGESQPDSAAAGTPSA